MGVELLQLEGLVGVVMGNSTAVVRASVLTMRLQELFRRKPRTRGACWLLRGDDATYREALGQAAGAADVHGFSGHVGVL